MKSDVYFASPVTLRGPSIRGVSRPIGEVAGDGCVVAMVRSFCKTKVHSFLARVIFLVPWGRNVYRGMTPGILPRSRGAKRARLEQSWPKTLRSAGARVIRLITVL